LVDRQRQKQTYKVLTAA